MQLHLYPPLFLHHQPHHILSAAAAAAAAATPLQVIKYNPYRIGAVLHAGQKGVVDG